jgi:hypothetical protein
MKNILSSLIFVLLGAVVCSAQSVLYFPHFVDGSQGGGILWATLITVTNPAGAGTASASGTITMTRDDGTPMNIALKDENGGPAGNTFQLAGGQTKFFFSSSSGSLTTGFATVTSNLPVSGALVFFLLAPGAFSEVGVPAATPLTRQATVVAEANGFNTGVGLANPGTGAATITFQLLDTHGAPIVPQVIRTLPANNHIAFFVTDLFPSAPSAVFGTLRITSDTPVVSTALLFNQNNFASLPVFPLE